MRKGSSNGKQGEGEVMGKGFEIELAEREGDMKHDDTEPIAEKGQRDLPRFPHHLWVK